MTWDEFSEQYLMDLQPGCSGKKASVGEGLPDLLADGPLPASMDWRNQSVVTPVQNQGKCGSCWAFSAAGAVESHHAIATKELVVLSKQQLLDCSQGKFDTNMCAGGWPSSAMEYIRYFGGLELEAA